MLDQCAPFVRIAARTLCSVPWRWHNRAGERDCANLWLIVGGRGTWRGEGRTYPCAAGDFFVQRLWHECTGYSEPDDPLDVLWANIGWRDRRGMVVDARRHEAALPPVHRRVGDLPFISACFSRLVAAFDANDGAAAARWLGCVLDVANAAEATTDDEVIADIVAAVRAAPEQPWRVAGLALRAGMPVDRFARRFHGATGESPRAFLVRARLDAAKAWLRMSDLPVGEIATRLGFCDIYHFSRRFRAHVGCAPTAYRSGGDSGGA
jgi:AraC-like DNA-binding protein